MVSSSRRFSSTCWKMAGSARFWSVSPKSSRAFARSIFCKGTGYKLPVPLSSSPALQEGRVALVEPIEIEREQRLAGGDHRRAAVWRGEKDVERASVMIPATNGGQLVLEGFRPFPIGGQEGGAGRVPPAEHEGEMVRVPVGPAGRVRHEEPGLRSSGQLGQVAFGEESVFPDLQPLSRRRQAGVDGVRPQLLKLLLGSEDGRDRPIPLDEVVHDPLPEGGPTTIGRTP